MVKKPQIIKFFAVLAAAWLAIAVVWAGVFIIAEHEHEHINLAGRHVPSSEDCRICYELQIALMLLEAFARLGVCMAITGFLIHAFTTVKPKCYFCPFDPIGLKVKFNC
jgi:Co/Zn/Cd efflux system component